MVGQTHLFQNYAANRLPGYSDHSISSRALISDSAPCLTVRGVEYLNENYAVGSGPDAGREFDDDENRLLKYVTSRIRK